MEESFSTSRFLAAIVAGTKGQLRRSTAVEVIGILHLRRLAAKSNLAVEDIDNRLGNVGRSDSEFEARRGLASEIDSSYLSKLQRKRQSRCWISHTWLVN